jgi:prepilin signal peptidase PulO-like enzyme (type II secretory pathway)
MPRRRRRHPNWPYRLAWCLIVGSLLLYIALGTLIGGLTYGHRSFGTDWWIAFVTTAMSATIATWFVAVGASVGSFLNVVAYRLPIGRTVGGHSGCPYCCSPIARGDNVPVLAWLKLRGRCRTCRLPISAQYPLVEFLVAMIFLSVFFTEVARNGENLPSDVRAFGGSLYTITVSPTLVMRLVSYLTVLCGLVAAALIVLKRQAVPLQLFIWSFLPLAVCGLIDPQVVIVPWRVAKDLGPMGSRFESVATLCCGIAAAAAIAGFLSPLFYRAGQRTAWIGGMAIAGGLVGWQAALPLTASVVAVWGVGRFAFRRFSDRLQVDSPAAWMWLGLLLFRAAWRPLDQLQLFPSEWPEVARHAGGVVLLLVVCWLATRAFHPKTSTVQV